MAAYKDLPIYRAATRLTILLHQATRKAPRDLRHTLVQRLLDGSVDVCVEVADANEVIGAERIPRIKELRRTIFRTGILLMIADELRCLSEGATSNAMEHIDSLGRQSSGWLDHTKEGAAADRKAPATTAN